MPPNYYDSKLSSVFESCLRKKFVGLNTINEVRSDYVKHFLAEETQTVQAPTVSKKKHRMLSDLLK
jgi:hypothetical protein